MKFKTEKQKGCSIIIHNGVRIEYQSIADALQYVFLQKFMAKSKGMPVCFGQQEKLYPVKSLVPKTVKKKITFRNLGEEIVR